ncbi:MAG: tellurite resistance/C4-dicarboxylate transporter family protein [Planctomycetaceae bacterium]
MIETFKSDVRNLNPGCFSLVMATGIVSIAAHFEGMPAVATSLFVLNIAFYALLWVLTLVRLACFRRELLTDLTRHATGPGSLTIIAGTCVLGSQCVIVVSQSDAATTLWYAGIGLWLLLIYTFFASVTIVEPKPTLDVGLGGGWLLATVATQSVAVLGALLAPEPSAHREEMLFVSLCAYLLGCMFYLLIITLIVYRFSFLRLSPEDLTPPYWINMGAVAITTLAGSRLILNAPASPLLAELRPFLGGFTLFFWATATWWIPLLVILGIWRHAVKRFSLVYTPQYWSIVFPLGMYTAATIQLSRAVDLPFLLAIPDVFVWLALAAWLATFAAMCANIVRRYAGTGRSTLSRRT